MDDCKIVLVGAVGMSPAVLTETVWALAQESPSVIPDDVVAITTSAGKSLIGQKLFGEDKVWDTLRNSLGEAANGKLCFETRVISDENGGFSDIATPDENEHCANFILEVLQKHSRDGTTQIIASIAGGRKTMSALMLSCMGLVGREHDRVCHVLVSEPFEQRLSPPFYFPQRGLVHEFGQNADAPITINSEEAVIQLSDIPFVCISKWQNLKYAPPSYSSLVRWVNDGELDFPRLWIDPHQRKVGLADSNESVRLGHAVFGLFYFWLRWMEQQPGIEGWNTFREHMEDLFRKQAIDETPYQWADAFEKKYFNHDGEFDIDDERLRKRMADARKKIEELLRFPQLAKTLVPDLKTKETFRFPLDQIEWRED